MANRAFVLGYESLQQTTGVENEVEISCKVAYCSAAASALVVSIPVVINWTWNTAQIKAAFSNEIIAQGAGYGFAGLAGGDVLFLDFSKG